ncbi:MAG: hypothetical protein Q4C80_04080 [Bacillota bacterium]|nr:hypothetical protein [Bacillota bacterium]
MKRAKKPKSKDHTLQIKESQYRRIKQKLQEFVMKRAFCIVITAFYDEALTYSTQYFKSKKKAQEFLNEAVKRIELYKGYIQLDKVVKFDYVAEQVYKHTGIDYRTYWEQCAINDATPAEDFKAVEHK